MRILLPIALIAVAGIAQAETTAKRSAPAEAQPLAAKLIEVRSFEPKLTLDSPALSLEIKTHDVGDLDRKLASKTAKGATSADSVMRAPAKSALMEQELEQDAADSATPPAEGTKKDAGAR